MLLPCAVSRQHAEYDEVLSFTRIGRILSNGAGRKEAEMMKSYLATVLPGTSTAVTEGSP